MGETPTFLILGFLLHKLKPVGLTPTTSQVIAGGKSCVYKALWKSGNVLSTS